jgi:hypothetical protein
MKTTPYQVKVGTRLQMPLFVRVEKQSNKIAWGQFQTSLVFLVESHDF